MNDHSVTVITGEMIRLLCNCEQKLAKALTVKAKALSMKIENSLSVREENSKIQ